MSIIHSLTPPDTLHYKGPAVQVNVYQPQKVTEFVKRQTKNQPAFFTGNFLIDTGAFGTIIRPGIAQELELIQTGFRKVTGVNYTSEHPTFAAALHLIIDPKQAIIEQLEVIECPITGFDGLIGRDFLKNKLLVYTGFVGSFTVAV